MSKDYFKAKASQPALDPVSLPDSHNAAAHFRRIGKNHMLFLVSREKREVEKGWEYMPSQSGNEYNVEEGKGRTKKARWNETRNGGKRREGRGEKPDTMMMTLRVGKKN